MAGHSGPKIGNGEGYGSGTPPTTLRGSAVQGSDDFYVQKVERMDGDWDYERANITPGLVCEGDDD